MNVFVKSLAFLCALSYMFAVSLFSFVYYSQQEQNWQSRWLEETSTMMKFMNVSSSTTITEEQVKPKPKPRTTAARYADAWYIDDAPRTFRQYDKTYAKHFRHLLEDPNFVPYQVPVGKKNGTSILQRGTNTKLAHDPVLTALRKMDRSTYQSFHPVCHQYRFPNVSLFPQVSILMPIQNERPGLLSLTIHSLLARTPPALLKEIIMVDDNFDNYDNENSENRRRLEEFEHIQSLSPKIIYMKNARPLGCAGSRLVAARRATAEVLVIVDSHIEMYSSDWLQHLLLPILENPKTLSMQTLDVLDDRIGFGRRPASVQNSHYGVIDDLFFFDYATERRRVEHANHHHNLEAERPSFRLPYESPFVPGSLFALRRDEFWRLGGYDAGLAVWGGENVELALKVWMCGFNNDNNDDNAEQQHAGRVVVSPCSRVGHVYRIHVDQTGHWPPPLANETIAALGLRRPGAWSVGGGGGGETESDFGRICTRNNLRILYVWGNQQALRGFMKTKFSVNSTQPNALSPEWRPFLEELPNDPDIQEQLRIQKANQCRDFDWFDRNVYYRLVGKHTPWHPSEFLPVSCGEHRARSCGQCPEGNGETWCNGDCEWCEYGTVDDDDGGVVTGSLTEDRQCVARTSQCRAGPGGE